MPRQVSRDRGRGVSSARGSPARRCDSTRPTVPRRPSCVSLALEKAVERAGFTQFRPRRPVDTFAAAAAGRPSSRRRAPARRSPTARPTSPPPPRPPWARCTDRNAARRRPADPPAGRGPLGPGRGAQFAAARALVALDPPRPVRRLEPGRPGPRPVRHQPGPAAGRRHRRQRQPRQPARRLPDRPSATTRCCALTGDRGLPARRRSADVELILIDHHLIHGDWRLTDTLANLRADARTAASPSSSSARATVEITCPSLERTSFPGGTVPGQAARRRAWSSSSGAGRPL